MYHSPPTYGDVEEFPATTNDRCVVEAADQAMYDAIGEDFLMSPWSQLMVEDDS